MSSNSNSTSAYQRYMPETWPHCPTLVFKPVEINISNQRHWNAEDEVGRFVNSKMQVARIARTQWQKVVGNYQCNLATLWRIPLKMQDRHLRQQNLTLFRNTHGALLYLLTLVLRWQLQKSLETKTTNSLSCQRKWFTWLSKSRRVWSRHNNQSLK